MSKLAAFGVIGGGLIVVAAFLTGTGFKFDSGALDNTLPLVLFIAGIAVILFTLAGMSTLAAYSAGAVTGLFLVEVIELVRAEEFEFTVKIVVLLAGVVLALLSTIPPSKAKAVQADAE
ncbi:MAG: hypothetical protein MUP36_01230 [Demequinaceae bacterium]|nr:hypothetical protein [Demequinaceae bacterium]